MPSRALIVVSATRQKNVRQKNKRCHFSVLHFSVWLVLVAETTIKTPSRSRSRTVSSSPQRPGAGTPGGGGACAEVVLNIWPMKPPGVQLAIAMRPPGRLTRISSAAAFSGRGANIAPNMVMTVSNQECNKSCRNMISHISLTESGGRCRMSAPKLFAKFMKGGGGRRPRTQKPASIAG